MLSALFSSVPSQQQANVTARLQDMVPLLGAHHPIQL